MKNSLAVTLITRGIINNSTKFKSYYKGRDLGMDSRTLVDYFSISDVKEHNGSIVFHAYRPDGFTTVLSAEDIMEIDGMDPKTFANAYDLNDDGTKKRIGAKRGRKSKHDGQYNTFTEQTAA